MHDAEHENDAVVLDHVVHHAVVPHTEPVKRVGQTMKGLDRLATDSTLARGFVSQLLEGGANPCPSIGWQLPKGLRGVRRQLDAIGAQPRS